MAGEEHCLLRRHPGSPINMAIPLFLAVSKISWMGFSFRVWRSKNPNSMHPPNIDLVHPLNRYKKIPCLTFQQLLSKHLRKRFKITSRLDIVDWEQGV